MTEDFLQYIWKHGLYNRSIYNSSTGEEVEILHPGEYNTNGGPDFINARIKTKEAFWAGNCEIHLRSSDWRRHGHDADKAYDNVILHVVQKHDSDACNSKGMKINTIELSYSKLLEDNYKQLLANEFWIPCERQIKSVNSLYVSQMLTKCGVERLEIRSENIMQSLAMSKQHWEEAFYIHLARYFGFKVNGAPFEMLAKSLPLNILARHRNSLPNIESLLFGQAGFLDDPSITDAYYLQLSKEYSFYKGKYSLKPIEQHLWKYMRLRPHGFPQVRIAQFAQLVYLSQALFSKILEAQTVEELGSYFELEASEFWTTHYRFERTAKSGVKKLSKESISLLLVNCVIPFILVYGKVNGKDGFTDKAVSFMEAIKPEKNTIIAKWSKAGINPRNAFESQALIQLFESYCKTRKCLSCHMGDYLISKTGNEIQ